jgi:hypothetical protein
MILCYIFFATINIAADSVVARFLAANTGNRGGALPAQA